MARVGLLFRFLFVDLVLAASGAELFEFKFLSVLHAQIPVGLVVEVFALSALETNEIILGHRYRLLAPLAY